MPTVGEAIAASRRIAGLTQEQLAEVASLSVETIRKIEQGERIPRLATLNTLARALQTTTSALLGDASAGAARKIPDADDVALVDIRRMLLPVPGLPVEVPDAEVTAASVEQRIRQADAAYSNDGYATLINDLPGMLLDVRRLTEASPTEDAWRYASAAHVVTTSCLIQLRHHDLAYQAAMQALDAARRASDDLWAARVSTRMCWLLMRQGRIADAERLAITAADQIEPRFRDSDSARIAEWGWLLCFAAAAAARDNRPSDAGELLDAAAAGAARLGDRIASGLLHWTSEFGPGLVVMKRVEAMVVGGDPAGALRLADQLPDDPRLITSDLHRHRLDIANAHVLAGNVNEAVATLRKVRATAPLWLRHQRYARDIVHSIAASRRRAMTRELAELADFVGATDLRG